MATTQRNTELFGTDVEFAFSRPWGAYWMVLLRLLVGYWFLHAGWTKIVESGGFDASGYLQFAATGTLLESVVAPFTSGVGLEFVNLAVPFGEFAIALGLLVGLLVRTAAFFGGLLMAFFYTINASWSHGLVNGDLFGLLLFVTVAVFGAGRVLGLDAVVERTRLVRNNT
jgi:thiosulfate dehydrogenase [quinone] large subunit